MQPMASPLPMGSSRPETSTVTTKTLTTARFTRARPHTCAGSSLYAHDCNGARSRGFLFTGWTISTARSDQHVSRMRISTRPHIIAFARAPARPPPYIKIRLRCVTRPRRHKCSPNRQFLDLRSMAENGLRGEIPSAQKNAQQTVRGRIFFQIWNLRGGPKKGPKRVPRASTTALRVSPATRRALIDPFGPCSMRFGALPRRNVFFTKIGACTWQRFPPSREGSRSPCKPCNVPSNSCRRLFRKDFVDSCFVPPRGNLMVLDCALSATLG